MVYLGSLKKITNDSYAVGFVHFRPFDLVHGMRNKNGTLKTEAELLETGKLVEEVPPCDVEGGELRYDPFTNAVSWVAPE